MIERRNEDCGPLTPQYLLSRKRYGDNTRKAQRPLLFRGTENSSAVSAKRQRFDRAFRKSIAIRVRVLGRKLTSPEFKALVIAVRKQLQPRLENPISRAIGGIEQRVKQLELATPTHVQELESAISLFQTQITVLREQALRSIIENDNLSEACSHIQNKSFISPPQDGTQYTRKFEMLGSISTTLRQQEVICCQSCLSKRQDSVFMWTGHDVISLADFMDPELPRESHIRYLIKHRLSRVHPLSVQSIWTAIVNAKYQRNFEHTLTRKTVDVRSVPDPKRPGKKVTIKTR